MSQIALNFLSRPNVALSALHQTHIPDLNAHTPYVPPHPQRGTPYHRYVLLLLPQPPALGSSYTRNAEARAQPGLTTSAHLDIPYVTDVQRNYFDVRTFVRQWGLDGVKGGGVHMWRGVWSEAVSRIYADILSECLLPLGEVGFSFILSLLCREGRTKLWQTTKGRSIRGVEGD